MKRSNWLRTNRDKLYITAITLIITAWLSDVTTAVIPASKRDLQEVKKSVTAKADTTRVAYLQQQLSEFKCSQDKVTKGIHDKLEYQATEIGTIKQDLAEIKGMIRVMFRNTPFAINNDGNNQQTHNINGGN